MKFNKVSALILVSAFIFLFNCKGDNTPYAVVNGKKITLEDLKEISPEQYNEIQSDYHNKIVSALKEAAVQKMVEEEAKAKGVKTEQYMQDFYTKIPDPSPEEVNKVFLSLKSAGRIPPGSNHGQLQQQIVEYLKREKASELIQNEINVLKKKYEYKIVAASEEKRTEVNIDGEPFRGNPNAKVVIVEFSDYECPFCQRAQKVSAQIREKYGDKVKWVFKDFPLDFHDNAMAAHMAGNCVFRDKPEQFWKFFDIVFSENRDANTLSPGNLERVALSLGISKASYTSCMNDEAVKKEISEDISQGSSIGVTGTPAFFINGRKLSGALPFSEFEAIIEEEL